MNEPLLNPRRHEVTIFEPKPETPDAPRQARNYSCILYRWLETAVHRLQADYAKDGNPSHKQRALDLWKLIINCIAPLASEARGKEYAFDYDRLAEEVRDLATRGATPAGIIAEVQRELAAPERMAHLKRLPKPVILPLNLPYRRAQVAVLMAEGFTDGQIAERLGISKATVAQHLRFVYAYCHAGNRTIATRRLVESGELARFKKEDEQ